MLYLKNTRYLTDRPKGLPMHLIPLPEELRAQLPVVLASLNLPATLNEQQTAQLQRVLIGSHYAHKQLQHNPDWLQQLLTDPMSQVQPLALLDDETAAAKALRNYRNHQMVGIIWRDLNRLVSPQATCYALSHLADTCIQAAVDFLYPRLCETFGQPLDKQGKAQGLFVIGMG
ncbi:MAG: hypothetical protein EOO68_29435, partial [Moraxellaceae bacterium]